MDRSNHSKASSIRCRFYGPDSPASCTVSVSRECVEQADCSGRTEVGCYMSDIFKMYMDVSTAIIKGAAKAGAKAGSALSGAVERLLGGPRGARRGVLAPVIRRHRLRRADPTTISAACSTCAASQENWQAAEFPLGRVYAPGERAARSDRIARGSDRPPRRGCRSGRPGKTTALSFHGSSRAFGRAGAW